jgi:hypothetical protein
MKEAEASQRPAFITCTWSLIINSARFTHVWSVLGQLTSKEETHRHESPDKIIEAEPQHPGAYQAGRQRA